MAETDSDNALLPRIGGGGIPAPVLVNPLAAMNQGLATAGHLWEVEGARAKQAAGQAFLDSIDPATGQPNQAKLLQNLRNNPATALAAQPSAQSGATLDTTTTDLKLKRLTSLNAAAMGLVAQYPNGVPADAFNAEIDRLGPTLGLSPEQIADAKRSMGPDPVANSRTIIRNGMSNLSAQDALHAGLPSRSPQSLGGEVVHPDVNPITNPAGPGSLRTSASPEQQGGLVSVPIPVDKDGNYTSDPNKVVRYDNKNIPRQFLPGLPLPGGPGTQPQGPQPPAPTGGAAPPLPVGAPPLPPKVELKTGYQPRPGAVPAGGAPPAPNAAAPAVPPQTPVAPGVSTGPGGVPMVSGAPPQGQPEKLKADVEAYTQDQAAVPAIATRSQNMGHAYEALKLLQSATGKGAAGINEIRSRMQTLGLLPEGAVNEQKLVEIFTKYTERAMIEAAGGASTDMGRRMSEQSNAGTLLSTPANIDILRNDMGKTLQTFAAYKDAPDQTGNGYLKHRADVADKTDPRGFVWELYTAEEQARINKEVEGNKVASDKLHKAMGMARRLNLQIPGVTGAPPPQKQSFVAPPTSPPNALMMTG